jgi:hypothetical protein
MNSASGEGGVKDVLTMGRIVPKCGLYYSIQSRPIKADMSRHAIQQPVFWDFRQKERKPCTIPQVV